MKVVFVVQGEGRGHMTQAITMKELLCSNGHEVTKVLVGRSKSRSLPDFFKRNSGAGISADDFDISRLISFADTFKPNNGFRQWANNSDLCSCLYCWQPLPQENATARGSTTICYSQ